MASSDRGQNSYNDFYAEWDTYETIYAIRDALLKYHEVTLIEFNELAYDSLLKLKPDIVFNVSEGMNGSSREAQIPAILDLLKIPYTGSDPLTLATCLNKARTKEILTYHKIRNPKFWAFDNFYDTENHDINFPAIVKPLHEGSSKGIFNSSIVNNSNELKDALKNNLNRYRQPLLVEEFLPGREFTVALLGNNSDLKILPIVELNFDEFPKQLKPIYSFEAKWVFDTVENPLNIFTCPAHLEDNLKNEIEEIASDTFRIFNCKDWCRIDIRLDKDNKPNVIELNPLPGVLPNPDYNSCYPKAARSSGLTYNQMINSVLNAALKRYGMV